MKEELVICGYARSSAQGNVRVLGFFFGIVSRLGSKPSQKQKRNLNPEPEPKRTRFLDQVVECFRFLLFKQPILLTLALLSAKL